MTRRLTIFSLATLLGVAALGCQATAFRDGSGGSTTSVKAAYRGLENRSVAVLVRRADPTVRPLLGYELGASVSLRLQDRVPGISVVSADHVRAYQQRNPQWARQPYTQIARALKADRLVVVLVEKYRLQDDQQLRWHGRVQAQIDIIEVGAKKPEQVAAQFDILTLYPQTPRALAVIHNEQSLRLATGQEFSIKVVNHFHDHAVWRID
jgi:hypothetical protein